MLPLFSAMAISSVTAAPSSGTPVSFNGLFSTTANASSIESPLLTADVPGGSSGILLFQGFSMTGFVTLYADVNGGGYSAIGEDDSVTLTDGQTLQIRISGVSSGEALAFDLVDSDTGQLVEMVALVRP